MNGLQRTACLKGGDDHGCLFPNSESYILTQDGIAIPVHFKFCQSVVSMHSEKVFMSMLHDTSVSCKICINNNYLMQLNFHDCFEISLGTGF